jgi:TPR repeat protein
MKFKKLSLVFMVTSSLVAQATYAMKDKENKQLAIQQKPCSSKSSIEESEEENLELCYSLYTRGLEQRDPKERIEYFRSAAFNGHTEAMYDVAMMYENGEGVDPNPEEALKLYKKARDLNDDEGKENYIRLSEILFPKTEN